MWDKNLFPYYLLNKENAVKVSLQGFNFKAGTGPGHRDKMATLRPFNIIQLITDIRSSEKTFQTSVP